MGGSPLFCLVGLACPADTDVTFLERIYQGMSTAASRFGATIIGGMLAGLDRRTAAEFSFYLAIPMLGGVTLYELVSNLDTLSSGDLAYLLVGAAVAAVVSWIVIGWLLRYIAAHSFRSFGYYRILAGIIILLLVAAGLPLK